MVVILVGLHAGIFVVVAFHMLTLFIPKVKAWIAGDTDALPWKTWWPFKYW